MKLCQNESFLIWMKLSTTRLGFYEKGKGENSADEDELDSDCSGELRFGYLYVNVVLLSIK